ncbi:ubiquitin-conjugating enzyme e2 5 [Phtheirospermum japonicum]|uniref:Ubiquitin-conjugating enzyme e2 5 n=1 Tax=Phtheirospermum japonicum TaxID=374723 RepID=A0A830BIF2_9LAMI|nr:ubiquitin-conjugating enzyme e2 5 [Phtheirospermum japonicum]
MHILTSLLPSGLSERFFTQMSMSCLVQYAWMLLTSHRVRCLVILVSLRGDCNSQNIIFIKVSGYEHLLCIIDKRIAAMLLEMVISKYLSFYFVNHFL